ncbi:Hypothetical protein PHPALM_6002 [Phytophthora palmivora]|uniref:Uncharacterized protein n=1 Tax=Phytophthora palmivora TaxID=4796 RepID=A0A2P4YG00_9STRA|nr:Hypothetical protein PHPALM_6002 [Phytophthora palmivora]
MNAASALSSLYFSSLCSFQTDTQASPVSKPKANSTVTILPAPSTNADTNTSVLAASSCPLDAPESPRTPLSDGYSTPKAKYDENQSQIKRKSLDLDDDLTSFIAPTPSKRKASSDFLRKGQWTSTEERLARLLIEAFEEGYLPIYTGIRLRGYLAVQLQCDPMRVSKKLCAGTIDGKQVPKNYGQKKYKLRKKLLWDSDEAASRMAELEKLTKALWHEARMRKPSFLTLSSTRNLNKRRRSDDDDVSLSSPSSPGRGRIPSSTPKSKKQKVFPIIYLNLSKLKHYSVRDDSSDSDPASPLKDSDSDSEPVRLDGESLQAAYDLLTLCSPRGSSNKRKSKKGKIKKDKASADEVSYQVNISEDKTAECKWTTADPSKDKSSSGNLSEDILIKDEPIENTPDLDTSNEDKSVSEEAPSNNSVMDNIPGNEASIEDIQLQDTLAKSEPLTSSM